MIIDAHQHFWNYHPRDYPWMSPEDFAPLRRHFTPDDLAHEMDQRDVRGSVVVQARQTLEETEWLLELASNHQRIAGVVGWVDIAASQIRDQLKRFSEQRKLVGVRHVAQDEPDDGFLARPDIIKGIEALAEFGLAYDILIFPRQLPAAIKLAQTLPEQRFVLDHCAKPPIRDAVISPWKERIQELASHPNVWCKLSGLVTEAKWSGWRREEIVPYAEVVMKAFGPERLMFGSDWPVCALAGTYQEVFDLAASFLEALSEEDRKRVWGENALNFYARG